MTTRIAPALRRMVETRTCRQDPCGGDCECHLVLADLRALLAVARAAREQLRYIWPGGVPNEASSATKTLDRAIARLSRSSHPRTRSRARGK